MRNVLGELEAKSRAADQGWYSYVPPKQGAMAAAAIRRRTTVVVVVVVVDVIMVRIFFMTRGAFS